MSQLNSNKSQSQTNLDGDLEKKVWVRRIQNKVPNSASPWPRLTEGPCKEASAQLLNIAVFQAWPLPAEIELRQRVLGGDISLTWTFNATPSRIFQEQNA